MQAMSNMAEALPSYAQLQLMLEECDGKLVDVSKAAVCLASSVLRHALEAEPVLKTLKVRGSDAAWGRLQLYLHPVPATAHTPMSPALILEVLPVAHFYDFQSAMCDCMSTAKGLSYSADKPLPGSTAADPLAFIAMAKELQVLELQLGPFRYISDILRQLSERRACRCLLKDLLREKQITDTVYNEKRPLVVHSEGGLTGRAFNTLKVLQQQVHENEVLSQQCDVPS